MIRNYLDVCLELPWGTYTKERLNVEAARKVLDRDHFGLEKVKERILETIAVRQMNPGGEGADPLSGRPSGRGQDLHRPVRCQGAEPEARPAFLWAASGTRRTSGATGKPISALCPAASWRPSAAAGAMNPLLLLDEIDKLGGDYRGDPASALLEVLDSEQNHAFRDHFLEIPLDLSQVMFITTANTAGYDPPASAGPDGGHSAFQLYR